MSVLTDPQGNDIACPREVSVSHIVDKGVAVKDVAGNLLVWLPIEDQETALAVREALKKFFRRPVAANQPDWETLLIK